MKQEELRADLASRIEDVLRRARALGSGTAAQRAWVPPAGGWSAGQVLEHLVISNQSYVTPVEQALAKPARPTRPDELTWKPSIIGNLLVRSLQAPRKLPAPKVWHPGPEPRPAVLEAFLDSMVGIGRLMDRAQAARWQDYRLGSPASALVRLNLGDVFLALVVHAERHLGQIDRIRSSPGYPEA